jgi:hypothetical protein
MIDHDAAGLPELPDLSPFLTDGEGSMIGAGFNRGQEGTGAHEDSGKQTTQETDETSSTGASHGLIHHHEQYWAPQSAC